MENPYETAGRLTKAHKLAKVARRVGADAAVVAGWAEWEWEACRVIAGTKPPSETTRRLVVELLTPLTV